jgi:hypothetical protein
MRSKWLIGITERMVNDMETYEQYKLVEQLELEISRLNLTILDYQYLVENMKEQIVRLLYANAGITPSKNDLL